MVCAKDDTTSTNLTTGVAYTKELTKYVIETASKSEIVQKQLKDEEVDVFSNKRFDDESEEAGLNFQDMISVDKEMLSSAFGINISESDIAAMTQGYMGEISKAITADTTAAEAALNNTLLTMAKNLLNGYIENPKDQFLGTAVIKTSDVEAVVNEFMASAAAKALLAGLEKDYLVPQDVFAQIYTEALKGMLKGYITIGSQLEIPGMPQDTDNPSALLTPEAVDPFITQFLSSEMTGSVTKPLAAKMTEAIMQRTILAKVGELSSSLMGKMANSFHVDESKIAGAFHFNLSEEELMRLMETMSKSSTEKNANTNLLSLGYQDMNKPTSISFYFHDFESKELFMDFLDDYNKKMEKEDDEKVIKYTDFIGILMSSVKTIVDSVSYVLIAFVSISLIVSSIMIGIITYISVLERTKEIGVLRAIGASKRNISSIFNAETFIVGLCSGLLGILVTLAFIIPINYIIHSLTGNTSISAVLPVQGGTILVILSVVLTLIGGLIPSKQAAKKDPVLALRSE